MHPVLFQVTDNFFIGTYGVLIAIGLLFCVFLASYRGKWRGINPSDILDLTLITVVCGFLSARIVFIFVNWEFFLKSPGDILFSRTGFVFLGGLIGGIVSGVIACRLKGLDIWKVADVAGPSIAIAHGFGRLGCHFTGCCFGGICPYPIGIRLPPQLLPDGSGYFFNAWLDQVERGAIPITQELSQAVWPVQIMESVGLFLMAGILLIFSIKSRRKGMAFGIYLILYSVLRFVLEMIRGDEDRGSFFGSTLSTSQGLSILLLAAGIGVVIYSRRLEIFGTLDEKELEKLEKQWAEASKVASTSKKKS